MGYFSNFASVTNYSEFKTINQLIKEFKESQEKKIKEEMLMKRIMYEKSRFEE